MITFLKLQKAYDSQFFIIISTTSFQFFGIASCRSPPYSFTHGNVSRGEDGEEACTGWMDGCSTNKSAERR